MSEYTPGPWCADGRDVFAAGELLVARALHDAVHIHGHVQYANARLIAAAPDLLAALKLAVSEIVRHVPFDQRDIRPYTDAIAKATHGA